MKYWEVIAGRLSAAGWSWGCVSTISSNGQTIFVADAHRDDGKRFVVHRRRFTSAFQAFPIPPDRGDLIYEQWVRDYRLVKESVSYTTKRNLPNLKRAMQRLVHTYHPKATYKAKGSWGTPEWRFGDSFLEYSPERGNAFVWLVQDVKSPSLNQIR